MHAGVYIYAHAHFVQKHSERVQAFLTTQKEKRDSYKEHFGGCRVHVAGGEMHAPIDTTAKCSSEL